MKPSARPISDETFHKKEHILRSGEFNVIYRKGRSFKENGFVLCVMSNGLAYNRLGFSISSANIKLASLRNKIRRLFREVYRKNKKSFRQGIDMVLVARRHADKRISYKSVRAVYVALAKRAEIII